MKEIYFIRHGVPENDATSFRFSGFVSDMLGQEDHALSKLGRDQARGVSPGLKAAGVERLIASTMKRAAETARVISATAEIPLDEEHFFDDVREIAPGRLTLRWEKGFRFLIDPARPRFVRRTAASILEPMLGLYHLFQWYRGRTRDGHDVAAVRAGLDRTFEFLAARPELRIGVVCHSLLILFLLREIRGGWWRALRSLETSVDNCSVTRVDLDEDGTRVPVFAARKL